MKLFSIPTAVVAALSLSFIVTLLSQSGTLKAAEEGEYGVLVEAPGVEETYAYCAACHSERIVAQQGLSRAHWDELLVWMVEEQGMYEIDEPDRSLILDYLSENYNEDRPNFPD